jgi:hypothetical protein
LGGAGGGGGGGGGWQPSASLARFRASASNFMASSVLHAQ